MLAIRPCTPIPCLFHGLGTAGVHSSSAVSTAPSAWPPHGSLADQCLSVSRSTHPPHNTSPAAAAAAAAAAATDRLQPTSRRRCTTMFTGSRAPRSAGPDGQTLQQPAQLAIGETLSFADALSPCLLKRLLKVQGGCSSLTVSPTAQAQRPHGSPSGRSARCAGAQ